MNSVNSSTGLSMFELRYGRCPRVIPPLVTEVSLTKKKSSQDAIDAHKFLQDIKLIVHKARNNLTLAKVVQAYQADKDRGPCELFEEGDLVMLSTYHRREVFKKAGEKRAAK
ncbi:hypothetical protein EV368DRAFT_27828, partial [Lentinula lateritia]